MPNVTVKVKTENSCKTFSETPLSFRDLLDKIMLKFDTPSSKVTYIDSDGDQVDVADDEDYFVALK